MNKKTKFSIRKIVIIIILIIQTVVLKNISDATSEGMVILRGVLTFGIIFLAAWLLSGSPPGRMPRKKGHSKENESLMEEKQYEQK